MADEQPYSESGLAVELDNLKGSQVYLWLKDQLRINMEILVVARNDIEYRMTQGHAQRIQSLIKSIDDAAQTAWEGRETARRHDAIRQMRQKTF